MHGVWPLNEECHADVYFRAPCGVCKVTFWGRFELTNFFFACCVAMFHFFQLFSRFHSIRATIRSLAEPSQVIGFKEGVAIKPAKEYAAEGTGILLR